MDEQPSPGAHPFLQTGSLSILGVNRAEALEHQGQDFMGLFFCKSLIPI